MTCDLTPTDAAQRLRSDDPPVLLDVRDPWELRIARIAGSLDIPMDELPSRVGELPADRDVIVVCHHGVRSMHVAMWLQRHGHDHVHNLSGGIDAWSRQVDPSIPLY